MVCFPSLSMHNWAAYILELCGIIQKRLTLLAHIHRFTLFSTLEGLNELDLVNTLPEIRTTFGFKFSGIPIIQCIPLYQTMKTILPEAKALPCRLCSKHRISIIAWELTKHPSLSFFHSFQSVFPDDRWSIMRLMRATSQKQIKEEEQGGKRLKEKSYWRKMNLVWESNNRSKTCSQRNVGDHPQSSSLFPETICNFRFACGPMKIIKAFWLFS